MKRRGIIVLAAAALLFAGGLGWLLFTAPGARFVVARASGMLAPRLTVGAVRGSIAGPLHVEALRWNDAATGIDVQIARADVDLSLRALLRAVVRLRSARLEGVTVRVGPAPPGPQAPPPTRPLLQPPIDIAVDDFLLRDAQVFTAGVERVSIREAALAGAWTSQALSIGRFDLVARQGEVHFTGTVAGEDRYSGSGSGRFRWQLGERQFAGALEASAAADAADFTLRLGAPLVATLALSLQQQERLPWKYTLEVPGFDPRESLLPDSSLRRLALQLQGSGNLQEATSAGSVTLNDTELVLRELRVARNDEALDIAASVGFGGGSASVDGQLQPQATPLSGRLALQWQDITLPADLVGQELRTLGKLQLSGNTGSFLADGALKLGPPQRLADLQLRMTGTSQSIQVERLDVVQPQGRLAVAGKVLLQPVVSWTLGAGAHAFDPGALFSGWPGSLDFSLATSGALAPEGTRAQVVVQGLRGRLRHRALAGMAQLQLDSDATLAGKADISSGSSRVRVDALRGGPQGGQASAVIEIASLSDWLPDARGSLHGRIDTTGRWPRLAGQVHLDGEGLTLGEDSVGKARLEADVRNPLTPSGSLQLDLQQAEVAGFGFDTVRLHAQGDEAAHRASFDAQGPQLALGLDVDGALRNRTWTGRVSRLQVEAPNVVRLALQAPFQISATARGATLGQACLTDDDVRLCAEGGFGPAPAFQARYSLRALPLRLVQAFVELPVGIEGTLEGEGDLQRAADGGIAGNAHLRSDSGRIREAGTEAEDESRELLTWRALNVDATLAGDTGRLNARATLNDSGSLDAQISGAARTGADPRLDGRVAVHIPGLGVVEAFVPQLVNVAGKLDVVATIAGSPRAPLIDGEVRLSALGFDLPELGLKPREGELLARLQGDEPIALQGKLRSGEGTLEFRGEARLDGTAQVQVTGTKVLAADIPSVKLTVSPDLKVAVTADKIDLTGKVFVPSATVDLERLPSASRTRSASPDVVVVDDQARMAAAREAPLHATLELSLGDAVKVAGYGLDATVTGALTLREHPGDVTTGAGEVRVEGKYTAYAQDLTIRQGQLLFASTPIDNPRLSILAVREIDDVTAGFRVTGSARAPELNVFSTPAMAQSNALSYIITGKPLDEVGAGTGEGDALQTAARQLGTAAGGLLAKNVGKRLGVDEFGITDSAALGGAVLTLGEHLSPRLYLGYGVGLFDPGQVVTMRYKLSREFSLEAEQGTTNSRASVEFRKEK